MTRSTARRPPRGQTLAVVLIATVFVLGLVALVYAPLRSGAFIWDDRVLVERDAPYRHATLAELFTEPFWPESPLADASARHYRPLVLLSFRIDGWVDGAARQYHMTNVWLHVVACGLLAAVARRFGARPLVALVTALLWGLTPRLSESVAWISGRTDVLAGVLGLSALLASPASSPTPRWALGRAAACGALLFAALLAKEVAVVFAVALVVHALVAAKETRADRRTRLLCAGVSVLLPLAAYLALRWAALGDVVRRPRHLGAGRRLATAFEAAGRYAEMIADPIHPRTSIGNVGDVDVIRAVVGAAVIVAVVAALVRYRRRVSAGVAVAATMAVGGIGLVLHLVPLALAGAVVADRLLYVPAAGLALGAAVASSAAGRGAPPWRYVAWLASAGLAVLFAVVTTRRLADYIDEGRFWVAAAEGAHPRNPVPLLALAGIVRDAGETDRACRLFERATERASSNDPRASSARRARENLISCWARSGRYEDAAALAERLAAEHPEVGRVQMTLGFARLHVRDFDGATRAFASAVELDPRLGPLVAPAAEDVAIARREAPLFDAGALARGDRLAYARHLARLGHLPEAEAAHLAIAEDAAAPAAERHEALAFLLAHGQVDRARRALSTSAYLTEPAQRDADARLSLRASRRDGVLVLSERIDALASRRAAVVVR